MFVRYNQGKSLFYNKSVKETKTCLENEIDENCNKNLFFVFKVKKYLFKKLYNKRFLKLVLTTFAKNNF